MSVAHELILPRLQKQSRPAINWTAEKIELLKQKFSITFNKDLAQELGVSWRTLVRKARELKLQKEQGFCDNKRGEIVKRIARVRRPNASKGVKGWSVPGGENFRFKKGHVPPQKNNPELITPRRVYAGGD